MQVQVYVKVQVQVQVHVQVQVKVQDLVQVHVLGFNHGLMHGSARTKPARFESKV